MLACCSRCGHPRGQPNSSTRGWHHIEADLIDADWLIVDWELLGRWLEVWPTDFESSRPAGPCKMSGQALTTHHGSPRQDVKFQVER